MNRWFRKIPVLVLAAIFPLLAQAQEKPVFSSEPSVFVTELAAYFGQPPLRQKDELAALLKNIQRSFSDGSINSVQQESMIESANRLRLEELKPFPDVFNFISTAMACLAGDSGKENFLLWNSSFQRMIRPENLRNLNPYLDQCRSFFTGGILYRSPQMRWQIFSNEWEMMADSLPGFAIKNTVLKCFASRDSISVYEASGIYRPLTNEWIGSKGRINWERTIYADKDVYALLQFYAIRLVNQSFSADSAMLNFPVFFQRLLPGSFTHSISAGITSENATFPKFTTYHKMLTINNLFQDIGFQGGITLEGSRIVGWGSKGNEARLAFRKDGQQLIELSATSFVIRSNRINASNAAFKLWHEDDSIFHPGLQARYIHNDRELMLYRNGDGIVQSPFFNTFHELDMYAETMYWNLDEAELTFGAMQGLARESQATFESGNFFTTFRFYGIQGPDIRHPLSIIHEFTIQQHSNIFFLEEMVRYIKLSPDQVNAFLTALAVRGFIFYDPETGRAEVRERTWYYLDAINNRTDYDIIRIVSQVKGTVNARLNIKTFDLDIFGVPEVVLSSTQNVQVYPKNNTIRMKKGLDFLFQGSIFAGYFEFYARECNFTYDEFKLNMTFIDSLAFKVPVAGTQGTAREQTQRVKTIIPDISGELLIDHPTNKSSRRIYPRYPIFDSRNDSYVYYDNHFIQNGVYKRDSFYYHIWPFSIDSLNNFTTVGMSFNGSLYSGNIVPVIEEPLRVQPDLSLGFSRKQAHLEMPLYGGKATAWVDLSLSHQGLRGSGTVYFMASTSKSKDFIFHPDSMMAILDEFVLAETSGDVYFPAVNATSIEQKWVHGDDRMELRSTKGIPFNLYDKLMIQTGTLTLRSTGLYGSGEVTYENAVFASSKFNFLRNSFDGTNSALRIAGQAKGDVFRSRSYDFVFDFGSGQGQFKRSTNQASVDFPVNHYMAYMDSFRWESKVKEIRLTNETNQAARFVAGSARHEEPDNEKYPLTFISQKQGQDSLRFHAGTARFNLNTHNLDIEKVPYIELSDVVVFPADGKIMIGANAEMRPLSNAWLNAGKSNRFHQLYKVNASINGRKKFTASGVYDYKDEYDEVQTIYFNHIAPDTANVTVGVATISDSEFKLNAYFDFRGDIRFFANRQPLLFDGGFRIRHECTDAVPRWVKFTGEVDKQNVVLPLSEPLQNIDGKELATSIFFSPANNKVYSGFLREPMQPTDHPLLTAKGTVFFAPEKREYVISKNGSPKNKNVNSDYLKLDVDGCLVSAEGKVDFGLNLGRIGFMSSGSSSYFTVPDSCAFNLFLVVDFFFDANALDFINKSFTKVALTGMDPGKQVFTNGINRFLNEADARRLLSELNLYGTFRRFPRELSKTMILSDVTMKWNQVTRSFTSVGPIGIAAFNNQLVNRYVDGYIEIVKRRTGDVLVVYLQPSQTEWYFFSYTGGIMQAISSNEEFNNQILNLKENRRTLKTSGNEEPYQFIISNTQQRNTFLRRMRGN